MVKGIGCGGAVCVGIGVLTGAGAELTGAGATVGTWIGAGGLAGIVPKFIIPLSDLKGEFVGRGAGGVGL